MSASPSLQEQAAIVARLRVAGCVFAEEEVELLISAAGTTADLAAMVDRRVAGLPLEHVLGWAEFCGLRIAVEPGVFVPRRRTEFLVRQAVELVREASDACRGLAAPRVVVVDLCCGSGGVGAALAAAAEADVELYAVDIDPAAVQCARGNVAASGKVYEGDLYEPLPVQLQGRVAVLVANTPYVPTDEVGLLPREARIHEPWVALDGGVDGLDVQRRVAAAAPLWLAPSGHLLVETSVTQAAQTVEIFLRHGLIPRVASSEELNATVVIGQRPHHGGGQCSRRRTSTDDASPIVGPSTGSASEPLRLLGLSRRAGSLPPSRRQLGRAVSLRSRERENGVNVSTRGADACREGAT